MSREGASLIVQALPKGHAVRVYYDEASPTDSVLQPGVITQNAWIGAFILPLLLGGWLWVGWRFYRNATLERAT